MEGTAIGGSCIGVKRGSTGPEGCQETGRRRRESSASGDWLLTGAFRFLLAGLWIASVGVTVAAAAGADAGGAPSDESDEDRVCDIGTLVSR